MLMGHKYPAAQGQLVCLAYKLFLQMSTKMYEGLLKWLGNNSLQSYLLSTQRTEGGQIQTITREKKQRSACTLREKEKGQSSPTKINMQRGITWRGGSRSLWSAKWLARRWGGKKVKTYLRFFRFTPRLTKITALHTQLQRLLVPLSSQCSFQ